MYADGYADCLTKIEWDWYLKLPVSTMMARHPARSLWLFVFSDGRKVVNHYTLHPCQFKSTKKYQQLESSDDSAEWNYDSHRLLGKPPNPNESAPFLQNVILDAEHHDRSGDCREDNPSK
ncbi:MAG: hypothetical protein ABSF63_10770 [Candidatus Bathyarchaeia archaeon]